MMKTTFIPVDNTTTTVLVSQHKKNIAEKFSKALRNGSMQSERRFSGDTEEANHKEPWSNLKDKHNKTQTFEIQASEPHTTVSR